MASKKLKRAAKVAAGIGAAYLASQALNKKKPAKKTFSVARRKDDTFGADTEQAYAASKPKDTFGSDMAATYENVPAIKFLTTPGGISTRTPEEVMEQMEGFGPMAKDGKFIKKKMLDGGSVVARGNKLARSKPTKLF